MHQRVRVNEAAELLGISSAAVRARIRRGTLRAEHDEGGTVYVMLDDGEYAETTANTTSHYTPDDTHRLIDTLQEQLRLEREASAELRRLLAVALQRIPELEAPPDATGAPVTPSESGENGSVPPERTEERPRSWWQRVFGG